MSLVDVALLPIRVGLGIADAVLHAVVPESPAPPSELFVVDGMPEGVPAAALRPEPELPAPAAWPFGEEFPRTCGTSRFADGALFWTDFLYDDHGATGVPVSLPSGGAPPRGTYVYPDGPAARNGADIFRVAVGLTETDTWWRVDWNTLLDPSVPIALFTFDTDRATTTTDEWPAGAGVRSAGIDLALLVSASGARLIDLTTHASTPVEHTVDMSARSFLARVPRALVEPVGTWTVRLAAGLANDQGDGFADVPLTRGAKPGQPNVYNVAFRTHEQEKAHLNFWSDQAQADALTDGDVSQFSLAVPWDALADRITTDEPVVRGTSTRWYVSSVELGQGVADTAPLSTDPVFLGRVQPYSVCLPATYAPGRKLPLTLLLHSLALGQNQFAAIGPRLLHQVCEDRDSVVVTPLARGPSCWYLDEGELDVWEVWARVAEQLGTDPNRTVIAGYSMGGYGVYKLALAYPEVFAQAVVLAGPPACGVRLLPGVDIPGNLDPHSHCAREGDTLRLLVNARWLPFVIAHGLLDELVPVSSVLFQVHELDRLGLPLPVHRLSDRGPHQVGVRRRVRRSGFAHGHRSPAGRPRTHHLHVVSAAGAPRPRHRAAPGLVVVGSDGRPGHHSRAGGESLCRREVSCEAGPHAHHAAASRLRTGPRPLTRPVHRAHLADRARRRPVAVPGAESHPRRRPHRRCRQGRARVVVLVDHQRGDRHARADHACRAATRHDGAARRSADRSDGGGPRGSTHHHVDQLTR